MNEKYEEPEVHMFFHKQTKEVEQVEKFVRSLSITIPAKYEDEIYKLYPTDIYYIETIDRHTYLYTASWVYESSENLLSLEKLLEAAGFIRVKKNCCKKKCSKGVGTWAFHVCYRLFCGNINTYAKQNIRRYKILCKCICRRY